MTRQPLTRLFLCLGLLTLAPAVSRAAVEGTPWLTGRVFDPNGTPIPGAEVTAAPESSDIVTLARTNREDGSFAFEEIPPGPVRISVEADGYESLQRRIEPSSASLPLVVTLPREDFKRCRSRAPKPADDSPPMVASFSERLTQLMQEPEPAAPQPGGEPGTTGLRGTVARRSVCCCREIP